MDIRILGDLTIDSGPLSPKERSLLAALVLRSGSVVTASQLADAVWGDELPSTWPKQVQAAVVRIRRAIGRTAVLTTRDGYRLAVDPDVIDAVRFERLVEQARTLRPTDPRRAANALEQALALWTGDPYADLGSWEPARLEADRIGGIRDAAEEELLEARLDCGEHRSVVPAAERLVRAAPLRERRWAILATALYRSGRQADALAALRSARERFAEELGIEPGAALRELEAVILRQDPSLDAPPAPPETSTVCPYRGLKPFGVDDAATFFGRDEDIRAAVARLDRSPFLAISGASGSGKSSLVLAGVVPALRHRGEVVTVLGAGQASMMALRASLARPAAEVVVIDQFEELFHGGVPDDDVAEFGALLAAAVAAQHRVIIVVRSDFLDACIVEPSIGPLIAERVHLVGPLSTDGLRRAIEAPARLTGLHLEPGLVELILRDAAGAPGALPHVSHALVETWLRREGATLTVAGYEASGGVAGAIAQSADRLYLSLDADQRAICRSTLLRLVEIGADGSPVRRRIRIGPLHEDATHDRVLTRLADARLVSADGDSVAVAHESLALAWPRLQGWLEEDADGIRTMHALAGAASAWEADGRPDEDLFRGARLQTALEWREAHEPELTRSEVDFLDASARQHRSILEEYEARAKQDRRQNRRLRTSLATAVGLFIVSVIAGGLAIAGSAETERQRTEARIEALTSTALSLRATEPEVARLLAAEAAHRWPDDPRTRSALMGAMTGSLGLIGTSYPPGIREIVGALIPGTREAVVVTNAPDVRVVDIDTAKLLRTLDIPREGSFMDSRLGPSVSRDGTRVAIVEQELLGGRTREGSRLAIAELATGDRLLGPTELGFVVSTVAINRDGSVVAAIDAVGTLRLIDAADGSVRTVAGIPTHEPQYNTDRAGALGFTPDGRLLYGTVEGRLLVVDTASATVRSTIELPPEATNVSMAVLSDSLAITSGDRRIAAVDLEGGLPEWSQEFAIEQEEPCPWVAASVELGTVYCGDLHGRIEERRLESGVPTGVRLGAQLGYVGPIALASEGTELVIFGRGLPGITRWMLDGSGLTSRLVAPGWSVIDGFSDDGARLLVARRPDGANAAGEYTEVAVLDTETGRVTSHLPIPSPWVTWAGRGVVFGAIGGHGAEHLGFVDTRTGEHYPATGLPDDLIGSFRNAPGTRMYAARLNGEVWTIDPETGERIEPTLAMSGDITSVSTVPDGSEVLVTAWDVDAADYRSIVFDAASGEELRSGLEGVSGTILTARGDVVSKVESRLVRHDGVSLEQVGALPAVSGFLDSVSVSADGRTLSAFSRDGAVAIYDLEADIRIGDPIPVTSEGSGMLSADGKELVVNVPAGVAVWDLRPETHAEAACRMAGRDLTREEWQAYLRDLGPYRSTCGFTEG